MRIVNSISKQLLKLCGKQPPPEEDLVAVEVQTPAAKTESPLHALVIGINNYSAGQSLTGAVPDAERFIGFLKKNLRTPESQIKVLLDDQAKRQAIIDEFKNLAKPNNGIELDDPIVIYYAGHGSEGPPPPDRIENGQVQSIVPQDSSKENQVTSIPDYVIGRLLWDICQSKGDNITVIFDCCHSASGTRDMEGARFLDPERLPPLPTGLDSDILDAPPPHSESREERDLSSLGLAYPDMSSHVLLAACGHAELAWEREGHGSFTTALLDLLEGRDIESLTYAWCMQHFPKLETKLPQNPVCEGKNTNRVLFKSKVPAATVSFVLIKNDGSSLYLQAGSAQGITPQSRFEAHKLNLGDNNPSYGTLEVKSVEAFRSLLEWLEGPTTALDELFYGRQVAYGNEQVMKLFVTPEFWNAATRSEEWLKLFSGTQTGVPVVPVEDSENPDMILSYEDNVATFTTTHPIAVKYKIAKLPAGNVSAEPDPVRCVLASASRWNWHVGRFPGSRPFQKSVTLEFLRLEKSGQRTQEGLQILKPTGRNLNVNGIADIVVGGKGAPPYGDDFYGFRILNTSTRDLFAYLFQFDISEQSITPRFVSILPSGSGVVDPTLPRGVPLTLGYGSSGELPLSFVVDNKDMSVVIFKLFVTTKPTDFQQISQIGPFGPTRDDVSNKAVEDKLKNEDLWDTFEMTLVERRASPKGFDSTEVDVLYRPAIEPVTTNKLVAPRASSDSDNSKDWFDTPIFSDNLLPLNGCSMRLRTYGHTENKLQLTPTPAGKGWFEIAIVDSDGVIKFTDEGEECLYPSHSVTGGDADRWSNGDVFGPDHQLWAHLAPNDLLRVIVKVKGRGWANFAKKGELNFW